MKVIPRMQSGGGMPPLTYYTPITSPNSQVSSEDTEKTSTTKSGDTTKGEITNKDYLESLKQIDGLPSDMNELMTSVGKFYKTRNLFQDGRIDTTTLSSRYISTMNKIKIANFNKAQYDEAKTKVTNSGGLSEIAITDTGKVVVQDSEGQLKQVTTQEYLNNQNKYQALTNSNLLYLRAHNPEFSFKNEILGVVENGIGIPAITKMIQDSIGNLSTNEISKEGYSYKKEGQIIKGLEILREASERGVNLEGMSLDGMYKNKLITKDQYQQASQAIQYIYSTLPSNAHTLLEVRSGNTENPKKGALDLITKLVMSRTGTTTNLEVDFQEDLNEDGSSKTKKTSNTIKLNSAGKFLMGAGSKNNYIINPKTSYAYSIQSNTMPLTKANGDYIPSSSTFQDVVSGEYSPILDTQNVSMGMKKIDSINFNKIILSDGNISSIDFPIDMQRYNYTGDIVPDLRASTIENKKKAEKEIENMGIDISNQLDISKNVSIINSIYQKYNLPPAYNIDGTPAKTWTRFGVINAQASNKTLGMDSLENNPYLEEINDDAKIDQLIQLTKEENFDKENWYEISTLGGEWDDYYKGTLWIPIKTSYVAASANKDLDPNSIHELMWKEASLYNRLTKEQP